MAKGNPEFESNPRRFSADSESSLCLNTTNLTGGSEKISKEGKKEGYLYLLKERWAINLQK